MKLSDFKFEYAGYGHYRVIYTCPRGRIYTRVTDNMPLIDATMNAEEEPAQKDLMRLKHYCIIGV